MITIERALEDLYNLYQSESGELLENECDRDTAQMIAGDDAHKLKMVRELYGDAQFKGFVCGVGLGIQLATKCGQQEINRSTPQSFNGWTDNAHRTR